jgi:L-threonylcarbamoyladenylate synthase
MRISLQESVELLSLGEVVAIPTETVYGLASRYDLPESVEKIFKIKDRPRKNPLIIHLDSVEKMTSFMLQEPPRFSELAKAFWPGPLTLVVPIDPQKVPEIVRAGLPTQAFRIPSHELTQELLKKTGPLVAPSANRSGRPSASHPEHVEADFGPSFPVLDGGLCQKGVESTILIFDGIKWALGRLGAIPPEAFAPHLGYVPALSKNDTAVCPGQFFRHYAPKAKLHLEKNLKDVPCMVGFSDRTYPDSPRKILWGSSNDPEGVLFRLYDTLRQVDLDGIEEVWVDIDIPDEGLWSTLIERLKKAASS